MWERILGTWPWHNDTNSTLNGPVLLGGGGGTGCKWNDGMTMGSSDGEKDEDCKEARGVLVKGCELWLVAHFKSVSVKLTPENIFY